MKAGYRLIVANRLTAFRQSLDGGMAPRSICRLINSYDPLRALSCRARLSDGA